MHQYYKTFLEHNHPMKDLYNDFLPRLIMYEWWLQGWKSLADLWFPGVDVVNSAIVKLFVPAYIYICAQYFLSWFKINLNFWPNDIFLWHVSVILMIPHTNPRECCKILMWAWLKWWHPELTAEFKLWKSDKKYA